MNAYIADRIARQHADALMADASLARRVRKVRRSRRAAESITRGRSTTRGGDAGGTGSGSVEPAPSQPTRAARPSVAAARFVARPFAAVHAWLLAGQL
jgi:hypothetical protein